MEWTFFFFELVRKFLSDVHVIVQSFPCLTIDYTVKNSLIAHFGSAGFCFQFSRLLFAM